MNDNDQDKVTTLNMVTSVSLSPERVLTSALTAGLKSVIVVGFDQDGDFYFASTEADAAEVVYTLRRAEWKLMKIIDKLNESGVDPRGKA